MILLLRIYLYIVSQTNYLIYTQALFKVCNVDLKKIIIIINLQILASISRSYAIKLNYLVMPTVHPCTVMFARKLMLDNEAAKFN